MNEGKTRDEDCETLRDIPLIQSKPVYRSPTLPITLAPGRLAFHVAILCLSVGSFTYFAFKGFELPVTVKSSTKADSNTEYYNFLSGLCLAFIQVVMDWWIDKIQPAFIVFLHNLLSSSKDFSTPSRFVQHTRSVILFIVPIVVVLTLGHSFRGFQASPTVGFKSTMILDDFKKSQSKIEKLQAEAAKRHADERPTDTILKNAILQKTTPFSFVESSTCSQQNSSMTFPGQSLAPIDVDDLAFTGVVYGFDTNEWNTEINFMNTPPTANYSFMYPEARGNSDWPEDFNFVNMLYLFFNGAVMVDRAIGNSEQRQHNCTESDNKSDLDVLPNSSVSSDGWIYNDEGIRMCRGPVTSLFTLLNATSNITSESINDLSDVIIKTLGVSFPNTFDLERTNISMEKRNLTEQIQVEALTIDVVLKASTSYGLSICNISCEDFSIQSSETVDFSTLYAWGPFKTSFCGNTSCVFFDLNNTFKLQKEIAAIPFMDCSGVEYDGNYGGWYPTGCTKIPDQAVIYGIGSYITGDSFANAGLDGVYDINGERMEMEFGPYIENPRRHVQFTFTLLSYETTALDEEFDAQCKDEEDCTGIWYELPQTKRYLFAGKDMIPTDIEKGDFHSPTPLVQLNTPSVFVYGDTPIGLEYLNFENFNSTKWNASLNQTLANDSCSSLMESYLHQLEDNNYFLEKPLEVIYTSTFFYLMQKAGVTDLEASPSSNFSDRLRNVQLKGDLQHRKIALSIPSASFWISFSGCILLVVLATIVLLFPVPNAEYFKPGTTTAEKFVAMKTSANYPNLVYKKTLIPAANSTGGPMNTFKVERMTLLHQSGDATQYIELGSITSPVV